MKSELVCIKNGVKLYNPVPENEAERRELELREKRFANFLGDLILKYYNSIKDKMEDE